MSAPKNYRVRDLVSAKDRVEVESILKANPLWKKKHARELLARRRFFSSIKEAL